MQTSDAGNYEKKKSRMTVDVSLDQQINIYVLYQVVLMNVIVGRFF